MGATVISSEQEVITLLVVFKVLQVLAVGGLCMRRSVQFSASLPYLREYLRRKYLWDLSTKTPNRMILFKNIIIVKQNHFFFPFFFFFDTFINGFEGRLTSAEFMFYNLYAGIYFGCSKPSLISFISTGSLYLANLLLICSTYSMECSRYLYFEC